VLPQADLFRHDGEIAARQLDLPELTRPLCALARARVSDALAHRVALLHCAQSASPMHVCAALCSICRWRFAHQCSLAVCGADDTPCTLTARRQSPEFDAVIGLDATAAAAVASVLVEDAVELAPLAQALQAMLLIKRQLTPGELMWPLVRFAMLHLAAEFGLPTRLAASADLVALLARSSQRIFYLLVLYLVSVVARVENIQPHRRIEGYDERIAQARVILPRVVAELDNNGHISVQTRSAINGVNYVRAFRCRPEIPAAAAAAAQQRQRAAPCSIAASQALYVRCCGRLALCAPMHPRTDAMLAAMRAWTLRERSSAPRTGFELYVRYICLGCMQADAPVVLDPRGLVFCMDCNHSNVVWVNPLHLLLETAESAPRATRRSGPQTCVVGPHILRSNDKSFPVLGSDVICEEHARPHAWLFSLDPSLAPLVKRLLSTKPARPSSFFCRSARRSVQHRI
jgi:hypothetical protein